MVRNKSFSALMCMLGVGLCFASTPIWVSLGAWDPLATVWARALICTVFLVTVLLGIPSERTALIVRPKRQMVVVGVTAWASTAFFAAAFFTAHPATVYLLYYTYPLLTLGVDLVRARRRPQAMELLVVGVMLGGLFVFFSESLEFHGQLVGIGLATGSSILWVLSMQMSRGLSDAESKASILWGQMLGAGILTVLMPIVYAHAPFSIPSGTQTAALIGLGFFTALAIYLWSISFTKVPGHIAGALTILEAPLGAALSALLLGKPLTLAECLGGSLVLAATLLALCSQRRKETE